LVNNEEEQLVSFNICFYFKGTAELFHMPLKKEDISMLIKRKDHKETLVSLKN
jgi:hypothetical protein